MMVYKGFWTQAIPTSGPCFFAICNKMLKFPVILSIINFAYYAKLPVIDQHSGRGEMMYIEQIPLSRQMEMVFRTLKAELALLASGTIIVQIRNNLVGKFGVKYDPLGERKGKSSGNGLTEHHQAELREIGLRSLQRKRWTHGEMQLNFELFDDGLEASVQMESNYNMSNILGKPAAR